MVTKAKKALLASLAAFLCVMLTVFGLSMSVSTAKIAKADDTTAVAKIGETTYAKLSDAVTAAAEGDTVTLRKDTTEDVVVDKNITLDLGGNTLTGTNTKKITLTIAKNATATVKNGSVKGTSSNYTIQNNGTATFETLTATAGNNGSSMIDNWGTLTIKSGTYTGGLNVVKSEEDSKLTINGGKFTLDYSTDGYTGVIFAYGDTTITGGEFIQSVTTCGRWDHPQVVATGVVEGHAATTRVTGGSFTNNHKSEGIFRGVGKATSDNFEVSGGTFNKSISEGFCADGFIPTKQADGTYGVKEGKYVAKVGSKNYETLADAIRLAANGKTVTLLDNINGNFEIPNTKRITLDLNGFTLNGGTGTAKAAITNKGTLTITDSSAKKTGTIKRDDKGVEGETSYYVIKNLGTMTINQANVVNNSGYRKANPSGSMVGSSLICNGDNDEGATLTINGGKFTQTNFLAIKNGVNGTLFVNGGEITSNHSAIQNWYNATITGGTIKGQLWTDAWTEGGSVGNTVIGGNVDYEGEIVMDVTGSSIKPTLTVNGGNLSVTNWRITTACAKLGGKPAVQGGTFKNAVPAEYCADRFIPTQNKDGTYGVKACVAKVGSTKYETLAEAIAAAKDGDTVTLLDNIILTEQLVIDKNLTIDLGGFTLTSNYSLGDSGADRYAIVLNAAVTIKNGKIIANNARVIGAYAAMIMDGVTVENGIIGGHATIGLSGAGSEYVIRNSTINGAYSVSIFANNATVTITDCKLIGRGNTLYHNGSNYGLKLTVTGTEISSSASCGVYISGSTEAQSNTANQNGAGGYQQATFTRCTISGTNGIEVKYTNLTLNSCSVSTTENTPSYKQENNGPAASGFAVVSTDNAMGGTTPAPKGTIAVSGEGNYVGAIGIGTLIKNTYEGFEDASYAVSGGKFNHAILPEYCAEGFIPQDNGDGTFGVKVGTYVAEVKGVKYETLQEAIDAAERNATVTLLANTRENVTITQMYITLDLNGHTINGGQVKAKPTILVSNCSVTITDSSEAKKGTVKREDTAENSGVSSHYVIDIQGKYGFLKVEGGNFINNSGAGGTKGASLIRVGNDSDRTANPTLTINGGTFTQDNFIVIKVDFGTLHFKGGELNSKNSYAIENWRTAYIKGGSVNGDVSSWVYSDGVAFSKLEIEGGKVEGDVTAVNFGGVSDKQARVYVIGGTVTGSLSNVVYGQVGDADKALAMIEVTGGTFSKDPTKYVVESSAITKNENGTFGVEKAYLAKVGETSYYTMDEAFKAQTASGKAIVMLRDYTTGSTFNSGSINREVDLNGHTWTYTDIDVNSAAFEINYPDVTLTVKNGTVVSNSMIGLIPSAMSGTITYNNAGLIFENVNMTAKGHSGFETNGNNVNDTITLIGGELHVDNGYGIYFASTGTLTINGTKIFAKTMGVQICSGSLVISGDSEITVTGDAVTKTENDGAIQDGAAISIVNRPGYKGLSNIVITGGTFTAKAGNDAIKAYDWNNAEKTESDFTKADLVAVSGGTFSSEVKKDYLAKGYRLTKTGESYGVTAKYIGTTHVSLGTALSFSYKLRDPKAGETIKNAKASYRTVRGNLVEIDMTLVNGYYVFDGITPQMLDRKISVNVYVGDTVVYDVVDYSILDYLQEVLNTDLGKATVTKQLVADLAFYGKAAMNYVGYETTVVDKFIADNGLTQSTGDMTGVANSSGTEKVANVSVQFASQNKILIGVAESVFDDYSYTIKVNGTVIDEALWQKGVVDGYRVYVSDGFAASYITDENHYVEVEVLKNETSVQKVQCNVAGYCMKMAKNEKMGELAKATYYYGVSAAEYANFKG